MSEWQVSKWQVSSNGNCPEWQVYRMATELNGNCPEWQVSEWQLSPNGNCLNGNCLRMASVQMATVSEWQLSHGNCPNGKCPNGKWVPAIFFCHFSTTVIVCSFVCIKNPLIKVLLSLLWLNDFRASTTFLRPPLFNLFLLSLVRSHLTITFRRCYYTNSLSTLGPSPPLSDVFTRVSHFSPSN